MKDSALKWGALGLLLACLACWAPNMTKLLRNDQIIFQSVAQGINESGKPVALYGPYKNLGLWHPPLLFHEMAFWTRAFGSSEFGARFTGALGVILALAFTFFFLGRFAGPREAWASLLLFAASPAIMYTGMVPDHDGALVLPLTIVLAAIQAAAMKQGRGLPVFTLALASAFLLWGKLTTPPLLLAGLVLGSLLWLGWRQGLRAAAASCLGLLLFLLSWAVYCGWKAQNPAFTVEYMSAVKIASSAPLLARLQVLWTGVQVLGLPLITLYALLLAASAPSWRKQAAKIFGLQALVPMLAFSLLSPYFAVYPLSWKYVVPSQAFLVLSCALLWPAPAWWPKLSGRDLKIVIFASALLLAELLIMPFDYRVWTASMLGGLATAWFWGRKQGAPRPYLALGSLLLTSLLSLKIFFALGKMGPDSPPEFPGGELGFSAVVREIQAPFYDGKRFLCRKDVGFYAPRKNAVPIDPHFHGNGKAVDIPVEARPLGSWLKSWWPFPVDDWTLYTSWERAYVNDRAAFQQALLNVDVVIDSNYDSFLRDPLLKQDVLALFPKARDFGHYSVYSKTLP